MMQQPMDARRTLGRIKAAIGLILVLGAAFLFAQPKEKPKILTVAPPVEGGTTSLPTVTMSGTASPGASVGIYADDSRVATAFTPMDGKWKVSFDRPLKVPDSYRVDMLDAKMDAIDSKTVRARAGESSDAPIDEKKKFSMIQPVDGELLYPGTWLVTGTGLPLHTVKLYLDETIKLREVRVGKNRKWSANVTVRAGGRLRNLKAIMFDEGGKQIDYEEVRVEVAPK